MDRLTALNVFRQVAELGSFAAAAKRLALSPPAISKNIGELETHLGMRLINRTTRRMNLTEAGELYLARITQVLDDLAEADRSLGPLQDAPSGVLRVSAPVTVTLTALSRSIPAFLARHPKLTLDLQLDDRRVDIIKGGFDMAIRGSDNMGDSSLIARKLMTMRHVVCASPAYFEAHGIPSVPQQLAQHNCIRFSLSDHADLWEFRRDEMVARIAINGSYRVSSSLAIKDALHAGLGLSLIPSLYVGEDLQQGRLIEVLQDWTPVETTLYAVYPSGQYVPPKLRVFLDFLVAEFAQHA